MENDGGEGGSGGYVLHPSYRLCPTCLGSYLLREDRPSHAAGTLLGDDAADVMMKRQPELMEGVMMAMMLVDDDNDEDGR